jgi:hypothetical protein
MTGWGQPLVLRTYPNEKYFFHCQSSSISHTDVSFKVKCVNSKFCNCFLFEACIPIWIVGTQISHLMEFKNKREKWESLCKFLEVFFIFHVIFETSGDCVQMRNIPQMRGCLQPVQSKNICQIEYYIYTCI